MNGSKDEQKIQLASLSSGQYMGITMKYYTAQVFVVKCTEYDAIQQSCKTWSKYDYNSSESKTMDALKQKKLSIGFKDNLFKEAKDLPTFNDLSLGELDSAYSLFNTYFVIVAYKLERYWPMEDIKYRPDVFRVVFADDLEELKISKSVDGTATKVSITSGTPINTVRYFHTTTELTDGYDFETEYAKAGNGAVALEKATDDVAVNDGKSSYTLKLTVNEGEYYYVEATDLSGEKVIYSVHADKTNDGGSVSGDKKPGGNIGDTDIGTIILISLVVVFVLAVVLVIVQKIVDYKKKLY